MRSWCVDALQRSPGTDTGTAASKAGMTMKFIFRQTTRWFAAGTGLAAVLYGAYVGYAWVRYGQVRPAIDPAEQDALLDRFMPTYEIVERHRVRVKAPADLTFAAATEMNLQQSPIVRGIFKGREWIMRSPPAPQLPPGPLIEQMHAIGWGMLAEVPGREVVMGAVTQPWVANVVFRPLSPEEFVAFHDPDYVKIAWTLRAEPVGDGESMFRTETRAIATDPSARAKFRRYWSLLSPGIILIRWLLLGPVKADAEQRARTPRLEKVTLGREGASL